MVDDLILLGRRVIEKEAQALAAYVSSVDDKFRTACEWIYGAQGTVLLTGMGKSGLVARKWFSTFSSTGTKAYFINPAEASHGDLGIMRPGDLLIALSYRGETEELGSVLRHARDCKIPSIGVTGTLNSSLARQSSMVLSVFLSEEACPLGLAPTTSTTVMMALGDAIAMTVMQMRGFTEQDFARFHPGGALGRRLWLRVGELMHRGDEIPRVLPSAPLETVILEMTEKRLGLAVVMEKDRVFGIITDGDLRRGFQKKWVLPSTSAADLMTCEPKWIGSDALAVEALEQMEAASIQHLLIRGDSDRLVGILHLHDLLRAKVV